MVDLPHTANNVPQVRAPTPGVSPSQIAQPYMEAADTFGIAAKTTEEIARKQAHEAGVEAVTRDANGDLQVKRLPIIGPAADDYKKAVEWSGLVQSQGEARRADLKLAKQYQNDPEGYLTAADAFKKDYVAKTTKTLGPQVGIELGRSIDGITTQQYNSLLAQQQAVIRRNFDHDTAASIRGDQVDLDSLIETGGLDTPAGNAEANRLINRIENTYRARSSNPILSAPKEETAIAIKRFDESVGAAMFAAKVKKTLLQEGGLEKAQTEIDTNFKDQSIPASQRVANYGRAQRTVKDVLQESVKAEQMAARDQKRLDDAFEDVVIKSTTPGAEPITETDIKKSDASPAAKMKMLGFLKRDGMTEPLSRVSQQTSIDLLRQIRSGDMQGNGAIYDAYDQGKLSRTDFNFLHGEFEKLRTPEGEKLNKAKSTFITGIKASITKSNPMMGVLDHDGDVNLYRLEWDLNERMAEYRKAGKNPYDLLNPNKPADFMGGPAALQQYQKPLNDSIRDIGKNLSGQKPAAQPPVQPQRKPGETPDEYLKRLGVK